MRLQAVVQREVPGQGLQTADAGPETGHYQGHEKSASMNVRFHQSALLNYYILFYHRRRQK